MRTGAGNIPYEGAPTTAPPLAPPSDYQNIPTNPSEFGAGIGVGEQKLGTGAEEAATIFGQIQADDQANKWQEQADNLLYGTGKVGADGKPDLGFLGLRGADALRARPQLEENLNQLRQQYRGSLAGVSQLQFDNFTRRYQSILLSAAGRHTEQAATDYGISTNEGTISAAERSIALNYNDPEHFLNAREDMRHAAANVANFRGTDVKTELDKVDGLAARAGIEGAIARGDWASASRMLNERGAAMPPEWQQSYGRALAGHAMRSDGDALANYALGLGPKPQPSGVMPIGGAMPTTPVVAPAQYQPLIDKAAADYQVPPGLLTRVLAAENGFRPTGVSRAGARGIAQFLPSTAARYNVDPDNPNSAIPGAAHYLSDLHQQTGSWFGALRGYLGGDPSVDPSYTKQGAWQLARALDNGGAEPTAGTAPKAVAPGKFDVAGGDSIAVQQIRHGIGGSEAPFKSEGLGPEGTSARIGDSPRMVLDRLDRLTTNQPDYYRGKTVFWSTGASNDPSQVALAADQIERLKKAGATAIVIPGVGPGVKNAAQVNAELSNIAKANGAVFFQPHVRWQADGIHPAEVDKVAEQGLAALHATPGQSNAQPKAAPVETIKGIPQPGTPHLLPQFDNLGELRPLGPGEWLQNPNGSWSSERTFTIQDPSLNGGKPSVVPGLWIQNGRPVQLTEDQAAQAAARSHLLFPSFPTMGEAEKFANDREAVWEKTPEGHSEAQPPLWKQIAAPVGPPAAQPIPTTGAPAQSPPPPATTAAPNRTGLPPLAEQYDRIFNADGFSPEAKEYAWSKAKAKYEAMEADAARTVRIQAQQQQAVLKAREDAIYADAYSSHPKISPQQIAVDPAFDGFPDRRKAMIDLINNPPGTAIPTAQSQSAAMELLRRMRLPADNPDRIADMTPVFQAATGDPTSGTRATINKSDFDFLQTQFAKIHDPAKQMIRSEETDLAAKIAPQIDRTPFYRSDLNLRAALGIQPGQQSTIVDTRGRAALFRWHHDLDSAIVAAEKAGKDPHETVLNPASPEYFGSPDVLKRYTPSVKESLEDIQAEHKAIQAQMQPPNPLLAPSDRDTKDPRGALADLQQAVKDGKITRAEAIQAAMARGLIIPNPPPPTPAPTGPTAPFAQP